MTLVDVLVVLGVALVLPMALPGGWWWSAAAGAVLVSLLLPVGGVAAVLVLPWAATSMTAVWHNLRASEGRPDLYRLATVLVAGYALVAAGAFASSRLGVSLFGIGEPIVELTAVHYTYAGTAALVLAAGFLRRASGPRRRIAVAATALTALAPIVVALGFVTHRPLPQVGGAVLMTLGVWLTATLELRAAFDRAQPTWSQILGGVSGAAIWIPMVLAVAWASGQHWDVPALSIPDMERTHGVLNALAFVGCGLLARRFDAGSDDEPVFSRDRARQHARAVRT